MVHVSCAADTYLSSSESYRSILNLGIFTEGNLPLCCISPSTWGNQRRARMSEPSVRYVLGSSLTLHHGKNFKKKMKWEREHPPDEFNSNGQNKSCSKNSFCIFEKSHK